MSTVFTDDQHYKDIASAIRTATGTGQTYQPAQMAAGVASAHAAGIQAQWDALWDAIQNGGQSIGVFMNFAGPYWNDQTFRPKYDIVPTMGAQYMFRSCGITDLKGILERQGVQLDLSKSSNYYHIFGNAAVTHLPVLDMSRGSLSECFYNAKNLVSIEKLMLKTDATFVGVFSGCAALEDITIEGTITKSFDIRDSHKLTHESLMSILNALGTVSTAQTLSIGTTNLAKLTDAEKAIATEKGWTLA